MIRYIREITHLPQWEAYAMTGNTELSPFQEAWLVHAGEDGLAIEIIQTRFTHIESQSCRPDELREEFALELYEAWMVQQEFEEALEQIAKVAEARDMFVAMGLEDFYDMMTERYGPPIIAQVELLPDDPDADDNAPPPPTTH
jgi:hypothetical protein